MPKGTATVPAPAANIDLPAIIDAVRLSPWIPPSVECGWAAGSAAGLTEYVCRQPPANGPRGVPDPGSDSRARHELVGRDMPSTSVGRSESVWGGTEGQDRLRDESILIIDDCTLYRENLAATFVLNGTAAPRVAWDLPSLVTALEDTTPSVVLLNLATSASARRPLP